MITPDAAWNATLKARIHLVIMSPDVAHSPYIGNEVLVMHTKKDARFIPVVAEDYANDQDAIKQMLTSVAGSINLSMLAKINWYIPDDYPTFINDLAENIKAALQQD